MTDPTRRFTNRVENYIKYRPGYPEEMLDVFRGEMGLTGSSAIADIGSGTGISARVFLRNGNVVYGVEPNDAMRGAAEQYLQDYPRFHSIDGTSDTTGLETGSMDFVIAAQAFHWFDPETARAEFIRILRPGGYIVLIWNERQLDTTPFLKEYEQFLLECASDYSKVRHENVNLIKLREFFGGDFKTATFENSQIFDFEGLKGRVLSSSYMPSESDENYGPMVEALRGLFAKYEEHGRIKVLYDTNIHYYQV
jgi:SAM-dependent methyltransferase